jgi:hypothetical protein
VGQFRKRTEAFQEPLEAIETHFESPSLQDHAAFIVGMNGRSEGAALGLSEKNRIGAVAPISRYPNCVILPQPPLSHAGAIPDRDRAKRPPLSEPSATGQELIPGDRVEGLATSESRPENSVQLSELTKKTLSSSGMTTVA